MLLKETKTEGEKMMLNTTVDMKCVLYKAGLYI